MPGSRIIIGLLALFLLFTACEKRYAYLSKRAVPKKHGTASLEIINQSPVLVSPAFEEEIREYCLKRLAHEGYNPTEKNPMYGFILEIKVDSSFNHGIAYAGPGPGYYVYSRMSKGIMLKMEGRYLKTGHLIWQDQYDLYYFNDFRRDLYRTKGVLKYMLSGIIEK